MLEPSCLGRDDLIAALSSTLVHTGAVVVGPPAIGVSTVLRHVAQRTRERGVEVRIARLPDATPDRFDPSWPGLLVVDDTHQATPEQATAVFDRALVRPVLMGARTGALTGSLDWLWRSGTIERLDVEPLSRATVEALVEARAGGSIHRTLSDAIHHRWGGRPGFVRDEIDALLAGGHLRSFGDVMRATPHATSSPLAVERVRQLLAELEDPIADDIELLAVVGAPLVSSLADLAIDLPALAHRRFTTTVQRSTGEAVRLEPQGLAAAIRANLAPSRHLDLARSVSVAVRSGLDPIDQVRLAMTLGESTDLETAASAARAALRRNDTQLGRALGRNCGRYGPAGLAIEAEVLVEIGLRADAGKLFQQILDDPETDPATRLSASIEYSLLLLWDLGRADEAAMITDDLTATSKGTPFHVVTVANHAAVTLFRGRPLDALDILRPISDDDMLPAIRESVAMVRVVSQALTDPATVTGVGSVESLIESIDTETQGPFETAVSVVAAVLALELAGHLDAALATLHDCRTRMVGHCTPVGAGWLALAQARIELAIGRPTAARRAALEAWAAFDDVTHPSGIRWSAGATLFAAALAGDRVACNEGLATFAALPPGVPFLDADLLRARAWATWAAGDSSVAAALLQDSIDRSASLGCVGLEVLALHDSFRLFRNPVGSRLHALATASPAPSIVLRAQHVERVGTGDAVGLLELVQDLEGAGLILLAAEVAGDAAGMAAATGLRSTARTAQGERARLSDVLDRAVTPSLAPHLPVGLTMRERDIAWLARDGLSSRDIAQQLGVSVRTVNNLLQRVYVKLGIHGRTELAGRLE